MTGVTKVAVANSIPDALSIGAIAAAANQPILLVGKDSVASSVTDYLTANATSITSADVIGGTGVISDATANKFPDAKRHFGLTAYDTNNQVIQDFADQLKFDIVYAANGATAIDALSGAPLAAMTNSPIILTDGKTVPAAAAFISSKLGETGQVTALGGTVALPENIRMGIVTGEVTPVQGDLSVTSIAASSASSVKVVFNKAPQDTEKIAVEVMQGNTAIELTTEWNEAKTEATLTKASKFPDGSYTVTVKNDGKELKSGSVAFGQQKVDKIEIYSKTLAVVNISTTTPATQKGYASFRVLDQYGVDITGTALANNINFVTGVGDVEVKNGLLTISPPTSLNLLTFSSGVVISANDTSSGISTTATLQVTSKMGTLSDFKLKGLRNENGKTELVAGDVGEIFYLDFDALDIGGDPTTNYSLIKDGLIFTGSNNDQLTCSSPDVEARLIQDPADSNKGLIEVKAKNTKTSVDMPLVISAMTWAGTNSQYSTTLRKQAEVATIKLFAPQDTVASNESKKIPFEAYDQNGDRVTKYSDLLNNIKLNNAQLREAIDGTAYIENDPVAVSGNVSIPLTITATVNTGTGSFSMLTINVQKPAIAETLSIDTAVMLSNLQQGQVTSAPNVTPVTYGDVASQVADMGWDKGGFSVKDQYDRSVDMTNTATGKVNANGLNLIKVTSLDKNVIKVASSSGAAFTGPDNEYCFINYANQLTATAYAAGSTSLRFELVTFKTTTGAAAPVAQQANATNGIEKIVDTKSQTFTVFKDDDIKNYTVSEFANPIYMVNNLASSNPAGDPAVATKQEDEFRAHLKVYGATSSSTAKIVLRGKPVVSGYSSSLDFLVYDRASGATPATAELAYDQLAVVANPLTDPAKTEAETDVSVVVIGADGAVKNLTTKIKSSKTKPAASSIKVDVATHWNEVSFKDDVVTLNPTTKDNANYTRLIGATLAKYNSAGAEVRNDTTMSQAVFIAPNDQYGTNGSNMSRFIKISETTGGTASNAITVAADGAISGTFAQNMELKISATTITGYTKTIIIKLQ